jgi:hypothetical protein
MPATGARLHAVALFGYVSVAVLFVWPLPLHVGEALLGAPGGDTGVYVWNLWVFRHEIVETGRLPFLTDAILSATPSVPLTLHNYTTAANLVAFPLLPRFGTVATFNALTVGSSVLSAYVMFLFLRVRVGDTAAAWLGGLLYGFSPFMTARQMAHFSLVQAAALPAFALLLYRLQIDAPTVRRSLAAGAIVAWAFLSDPYYAVYCALMAVFLIGWEAVVLERHEGSAPLALRAGLDLTIMVLAGLVVAMILRGGGRMDLFGLRVSMVRLYTPVLLLTILVLVRTWIALRPRISWRSQRMRRLVPVGLVAGVTCVALLAPVLSAMTRHMGEGQWISPPVWWRSSAPGVDLLAFFVPNPVGTFLGGAASGWLARMPDGLVENVAAIPWTVLVTIAIAVVYAGVRLPVYWSVFTALAALLALGPFVHVAGVNTYIPTPWALLRYLPVIGAARMPTRLTILVMLGVAVLLACALKGLRARSGRPWVPTLLVGALMLVELFPAPRTLHPVRVPGFYSTLAADPRSVHVMHLPIGLRDGLSSTGDFSAHAQFLQTFHGKPLVGGYLSRLPRREVQRYRQIPLLSVLLDLSEGAEISAARRAVAMDQAHETAIRLKIGYVIVDTSRVSPELVAFARSALHLEHVETDGGQELYIVR